MNIDFEKIIDGSKFYSIGELENLLDWPSGFILKSAIKKGPRLLVCINVPHDSEVFSVDMSSIHQGFVERIRLKNKKFIYPAPSIFEVPQCESRGQVVALIVDRGVLVDVEKNWSGVCQKFFSEAYVVQKRHPALSFRLLKLVSPQRLHDLNAPKDVLWNVDSERARYAVYRSGTEIEFTDGAGYTDPLSVPVKIDALCIRGYDFIKWFKRVGYFYTGSVWRIGSLSDSIALQSDVCIQNESNCTESSSVGIKSGVSKKTRMNEFRDQVKRGIFYVMKERNVPASQVSAEEILRLFKAEANKKGSDFILECNNVSRNEKVLLFQGSEGGAKLVTKKRISNCINRLSKQIEEGLFLPGDA